MKRNPRWNCNDTLKKLEKNRSFRFKIFLRWSTDGELLKRNFFHRWPWMDYLGASVPASLLSHQCESVAGIAHFKQKCPAGKLSRSQTFIQLLNY